MSGHMHRPWPEILVYYQNLEDMIPSGSGMLAICERIALSDLARGIYGWTSMHELCITQTPVTYPNTGAYLRISPLRDGRIEFRYFDTMVPQGQWHRVELQTNATARLLSFFAQMGWFSAGALESQHTFSLYPQPEWNEEKSVEQALQKITSARTEEQANAAHNAVLFAVGNNHAGTYYPVAIPVIDTLGYKIEHGTPWSQYATVQVLLDLAGSFEPDPGYETFVEPGHEMSNSLHAIVRTRLELLVPKLKKLAGHQHLAAKGVRELLDCLSGEVCRSG